MADRLLEEKKSKKKNRNGKESESDVGPNYVSGATSEKTNKKKKKRNAEVSDKKKKNKEKMESVHDSLDYDDLEATCVNGAKSEKKKKKKKEKKRKRNGDVDDDLDVGIADKKKKKKKKKEKKENVHDGLDYDYVDDVAHDDDAVDDLDLDLGPFGHNVVEDDDFIRAADGTTEADDGDDDLGYDLPKFGDDDDDIETPHLRGRGVRTSYNCTEMLMKKKKKKEKKKKKKKRSAGDMVLEAIYAVAKTAGEAAISAYIASEKGTHNSSKRLPLLQTTSHGGDTNPGLSQPTRGGEEGKDDEILGHSGHKTAADLPLPLGDDYLGTAGDGVAEARDADLGPSSDDVAEAHDDDLGTTGDDDEEVGEIQNEWGRGLRTSYNCREMLKKKKSAGDMVVEAIHAVAKVASEAALTAYIAEEKKGTVGEVKHNSPKRVPLLQTTSHGEDTNPNGCDTNPSPSQQGVGGEEGEEDEIMEEASCSHLNLHSRHKTATDLSLPLKQPNWADAPSREANLLMKTALRAYNKKFAAQGVHKFAGGLHINAFVDKGIYCHMNFHVRLVDDVKPCDCDPKLIFAELVREDTPGFRVTVLDVLGYVSQGLAPALRGCRACDTLQHRNVLRHGNVKFNPGVDPGFWFKGKTREEIRKSFNVKNDLRP